MSGKKLLVADDSLTIQKVIRLALSNEGYEIQAVSDGNDAIQQITLFQPNVVLIDVSLPGKSAFEVKREINKHPDLEEIRFVLMSSAFEKVDETQAEEVIFHGRLTKPFDPAHLRQVLTEVLAQVTAKRMEKTSLISRSQLEAALTPAVPTSPENATIFPPYSETPPPIPHENMDTLSPLIAGEEPIVAPPSIENINSADWETTLKPEFPTLPLSQESETLQELWEPSQDPTFASPPPMPAAMPQMPLMTPPPRPPELPSESYETDIKELTESTMRMTGMDDYQWSVKEPSIKPLPNMLEGLPEFHSDSLEPPPAESAPHIGEMIEPSEVFQTTPPPPKTPDQTPIEAFSPTPPISLPQDEVETMVARQVEAILEKMARNLLPEIAEKLIKQEIHRLLSE